MKVYIKIVFVFMIITVNIYFLKLNVNNEKMIVEIVQGYVDKNMSTMEIPFSRLEDSNIVNFINKKPTVLFFVSLLSIDDIKDFWQMEKLNNSYGDDVNFYFLYSCTDERMALFLKDNPGIKVNFIRDDNDKIYKLCDRSSLILDSGGNIIYDFYFYTKNTYLYLSKITGRKSSSFRENNSGLMDIGSDLSNLIVVDRNFRKIDITGKELIFTSDYCDACNKLYHSEYLENVKKNRDVLYVYNDFSKDHIEELQNNNICFGYIVRNDSFKISTPAVFKLSDNFRVIQEIDYRSYY